MEGKESTILRERVPCLEEYYSEMKKTILIIKNIDRTIRNDREKRKKHEDLPSTNYCLNVQRKVPPMKTLEKKVLFQNQFRHLL